MIRQRTERIAALAMTFAVTLAALVLPANAVRPPAAPLVAHAACTADPVAAVHCPAGVVIAALR